ncbi:MAG: hypothetical protein JMDDDDMK_00293 [Acidobacteria bacterium]|nr:hypothetical protein [Acidobacteriota bacterium]
MPVIEIRLTTDQLISAYTQLDRRERRSFLEGVLTQPANQEVALEVMTELQAILRRKFPPDKQRLLDKLLDANTERELRPAERKRLEELIAEYGADMVEKARARYLLELPDRAERSAAD